MNHFEGIVQQFAWNGRYQIYIASVEQLCFTLIEGVQQYVKLPYERLVVTDIPVQVVEQEHLFLLFTYPED